MAGDYVVTLVAEIVVSACVLWTFRVVASEYGPISFGRYQVSRGFLAAAQPAMLLGVGVALPRYLAKAQGKDPRHISDVFAASLLLVVATVTVTTAMLNAWPDAVGHALFGQPGQKALVRALSVLAIGLITHSLVYALLRGHLSYRMASLLHVVNLGIVPLAMASTATTLSTYFTTVGMLQGLSSCVVAAMQLRTVPTVAGTAARIREISSFGIRRVVGDALLLVFMLAPTTVTAHIVGLRAAGGVGIATSVVAVSAMLLTPLSTVLLPRSARLLADDKSGELTRQLSTVLPLGLLLAGVIGIATFATAPLISAFLGDGYGHATAPVRAIALSFVPYAAYVLGRSPLDALHFRAVNTKNIAGGVLVSVLLSPLIAVHPTPVTVVLVFDAGVMVMGALTVRDVWRAGLLAWPPFIRRPSAADASA